MPDTRYSLPPDFAERISQLTANAIEISMGNLDAPLPLPEQEDELTELITAMELMRQDLKRYVEELAAAKEKELAIYRETIRTLSTPTVRIWDEILVLPLIGVIDSQRARQMTESLLMAIVEHQAQVVIIDITGVPLVDSFIAGHLIAAIQSAKMLGTQCVLSGVNPHIATTMVKSGVALEGIHVEGTLQAGLHHAFCLTGRKVVAGEDR